MKMAAAGGAEEPRRRRERVKIAVSGGGGILLLGGAVIAAAAVGAALAFLRSRTNRRNPPPPPADQELNLNEKKIIVNAKVTDDDTRRGLESVIYLIQKKEVFVHDTVEEDESIREIHQPPAVEMVTAVTESIQSEPILEGSEVSHVEESAEESIQSEPILEGSDVSRVEEFEEEVGKEEDGDKEEHPSTSSQEAETESSLSSSSSSSSSDEDEDEEEEEMSEEGSDEAGSSSLESTAEAVWPAEVIEQDEKASAIEPNEILGKNKEMVDAEEYEQQQEEEEFEENPPSKESIMAAIGPMMAMKRNKEVEFIIKTQPLRGFLLLMTLVLVLGLVWFSHSKLPHHG